MAHSLGYQLSECVGNNAFSYEERKKLGSALQLWVPPLIQGSWDDVKLGSEIVFEEIEKNRLVSCTGLESHVEIIHEGISFGVMDTHNHAFWCRAKRIGEGKMLQGLPVIHMDQHADLGEGKPFSGVLNDLKVVRDYVDTDLNIGNFLIPAQNLGMIGEIYQVRSIFACKELGDRELPSDFLFDLDLDFWSHPFDAQDHESSMQFAIQCMQSARAITIATSPFFIDQEKAMDMLRELVGRSFPG